MKILYAIQGTGNGHVSRARDIVPLLQKSHQVHVLISGNQCDVQVPFHVQFNCHGLGFEFGKKGGINLPETFRKSNLKKFINEVNNLPVSDYDLVISDFEPVSAWACLQNNTRCVALSHQVAVLNKHAPKPKKTDLIGKAVLKKYAPATSKYGFHFKPYDVNIFTPVIRQQVRGQQTGNLGHYTVYLPAYSDKRILKVLLECKKVQWQVFSKHNKTAFQYKNVCIQPINNDRFVQSMASCEGVLCGAGFETPAEALFMKKKLLVIPMTGQYEQQCNAAALKEMGIPVLKKLRLKYVNAINDWIDNSKTVHVHYPDITEQIINRVIEESLGHNNPNEYPAKTFT